MRIPLPRGRSGSRLPFPMLGGRRGGGRRGKFKIWPIVAFGLFALFYILSNRETVPVSGRKQIVDVSKEQETALGLQSYRSILSKSEVVAFGPEVSKIREIGNRIAGVTQQEGFAWEFNLIDSPEANAFALPGGKVAVFSGILPITANDDGLAAVMGHEIAHAIARHGAERMTHQKLMQFGTMAVGMSVGDMDPRTAQSVMGAFGVGSKFAVALPFSRKHESEADYIGLMYLARACFDPTEAPRLWKRMGEAASKRGGVPAELLSTHPNADTRIAQFKEWMPEALRVRAENCPT